MHWLLMAADVALGVIMWTFFEYAVHRWLFHGRYMDQLHSIHHRAPWRRYVVPFRLFLPIVAFASAPVWFMGWKAVAVWAVGVFIGWRWYEYLHYRMHTHVDEPAEACNAHYLGRLWLRHQSHHRFDHPGNFGVTTSFWDRVFRTEEKVTYLPTEPPPPQRQVADLPPLPDDIEQIAQADLAKAMRKALEQ